MHQQRKDHRHLVLAQLPILFLATALAFSGAPAQAQPGEPGPDAVTKKGIVYEDLEVGDGNVAKRGDRVQMRYTGWLADGTEFDSNKKKPSPLLFQLGMGQVIRGWDLGVQGMKVGGKRVLYIPAKLAYGKRGVPGRIPKNADLIFEVELVATM